MSASSTVSNALAGPSATSEGAAAAKRALGSAASTRGKLMGLVMAVAFVDVLLYLDVVDNSALIPGLTSAYGPDMVFYLFLLSAVAMPIIGFAPAVHTNRSAVNLATGGSVWRFARDYAATGFLAWLVLGLAAFGLGVDYVALPGAERLGTLIVDAAFVSAVEEITFRMALPLVMNTWVVQLVFFPAAHLFVDFASGSPTLPVVAADWVQRAVAAVILWYLYDRFGLGVAMAAHASYDMFLEGGFPMGAPLHLAAIGLVPV